MIREKFQNALNYLRVSRNLAEHGNSHLLYVLPRILAGRIFYGMGPDVYDRRRFSEKKLRQAGEYLTLREREELQRNLCPTGARGLVEHKLRFYEKCLLHGLPTPTVYAAFLREESVVPRGIPVVRTREELRKFLEVLPPGRYVAKPIDGGHGWGVTIFDMKNGNFTGLEEPRGDFEKFFRQLTDGRYSSVGYLFQEHVRPHRKLMEVMPGPGLGTLRVVTFRVGERGVKIPFAVLKVPVGDSVTDNFDAGSSGNWVCPIDVNTGFLGNAVGKSAAVPVFSEIERRSDTGAIFRTVQVPLWNEVMATVVRSALAFSDLRTIGWDIAVTDDGPSIIEANWDWGENIIEVAHNRGLRSELTELTRKSSLGSRSME